LSLHDRRDGVDDGLGEAGGQPVVTLDDGAAAGEVDDADLGRGELVGGGEGLPIDRSAVSVRSYPNSAASLRRSSSAVSSERVWG
jgi:hypothetical protein